MKLEMMRNCLLCMLNTLDYYVNGQRITDSTIDYMYYRELHDCAKLNTYMGLWQIAQASSVLNVPIQSVYPKGGDPIMWHEFNRWFFPINCTKENNAESLTVMWTSVFENSLPMHFVPLLPKRTKYAHPSSLHFTKQITFPQ